MTAGFHQSYHEQRFLSFLRLLATLCVMSSRFSLCLFPYLSLHHRVCYACKLWSCSGQEMFVKDQQPAQSTVCSAPLFATQCMYMAVAKGKSFFLRGLIILSFDALMRLSFIVAGAVLQSISPVAFHFLLSLCNDIVLILGGRWKLWCNMPYMLHRIRGQELLRWNRISEISSLKCRTCILPSRGCCYTRVDWGPATRHSSPQSPAHLMSVNKSVPRSVTLHHLFK